MAHFRTESGDIITFDGWIELELNSPIFNTINSYSLPVNIPVTPQNRLALNFPEEINSIDNKVRELDVSLISVTLKLTGKLRVEQVDNSRYEGTFIGQGAFLNKYASMSLRDIDYPTANFPDIVEVLIQPISINNFVHDIEGINICFPMFRNYEYFASFDFYNEDLDTKTDYVNSFENAWSPVGYYKYTSAEIPALEFKSLLTYIFSVINAKLIDNVFASDLFNNLYLLSNYAVTELFFEEQSANILISNLQIIDAQTIKITVPQTSVIINEHNFIKFIDATSNGAYLNNRVLRCGTVEKYWEDLITGLRSYYITISINTTNLVAGAIGNGHIRTVLMSFTYPAQLSLKNHVPDITFSDLIELLKSINFYLIPSESAQECKIVNMNDILSAYDYIDISRNSGTLYDKKLSDINSVGIKRNAETDDSFFSSKYKKLSDYHTVKASVNATSNLPTTGNVNHDIRLVETGTNRGYYEWFSSLYNISSGTNNYNGEWRFFAQEIEAIESNDENIELNFTVPFFDSIGSRVDIAVNSINTDTDSNLGIKLFYFKFENNKPLMDYKNNTHSLLLNGSTTITNIFESYINWKTSRYRIFSSRINWPLYLINGFRWDKKYRIKNTNFLISKIKMSISYNDRVIFGESEIVRV